MSPTIRAGGRDFRPHSHADVLRPPHPCWGKPRRLRSFGRADPTGTAVLSDRGVLTLPKALRDRYGFAAGDAFAVLDVDGLLVLSPVAPFVPELARQLERLVAETGLSTEDLLAGLRDQRGRYVAERYGDPLAGPPVGTSAGS